MARVQCRYCKEYFDKDKTQEGEYWIKPVNLRYYHINCYKLEQELIKDVNIAIKEEKDLSYRDVVYKYLLQEVRIKVNWNKFYGQWRNLTEKKYRKPKGIYLTLRYCYDILKLNPEKADGGIGIVDYKYDEASQYWSKRLQEQPEISKKIIEQINELSKIENIVPVKRKETKRRGPQYKLEGSD